MVVDLIFHSEQQRSRVSIFGVLKRVPVVWLYSPLRIGKRAKGLHVAPVPGGQKSH